MTNLAARQLQHQHHELASQPHALEALVFSIQEHDSTHKQGSGVRDDKERGKGTKRKYKQKDELSKGAEDQPGRASAAVPAP